MNPRLTAVKAKPEHKLEITFSNGEIGEYDCSPLLNFGVFTELRDVEYFNRVCAEAGTVVWPNGQDIGPDTLYEDAVRLTAK